MRIWEVKAIRMDSETKEVLEEFHRDYYSAFNKIPPPSYATMAKDFGDRLEPGQMIGIAVKCVERG